MTDLSHMTGENNFKRGQSFDEVQLDGNTGRFQLYDKDAEKGTDGKYPKTDLGAGAQVQYDPATGKPQVVGVEPLEVVFLKIRRIISHYDQNAGTYQRSSEHNHKHERVVLYGPAKGERETGIASELSEKYPKLKVNQLVYSYFPKTDELVRVSIKGASLGSKASTRGVLKFYDYLQSFKKDEHMYEYVTRLVPVLEINPDLNKAYFCLSFEKGARLDPDTQKRVEDLLISLHEDITQRDEAFREKLETSRDIQVAVPEEGSLPNPIEYPTEDISPDDIPF